MRNEENIGRIVRGKRMKYLLSTSLLFIKGSKKTQKNRFLFLINS